MTAAVHPTGGLRLAQEVEHHAAGHDGGERRRGGTWCATTVPTRTRPGQAPKARGAPRGPRLEWDPRRARPDTAGEGGPEAPMGESDPAGLRSGPSRVSSLRRRDARREFHHRARTDQAHPGSPAQAREGRAPPSSSRPPAGGQHHLRADSSRSWTSAMGEGGVVGPECDRCLSHRPVVSLGRSHGRQNPPKTGVPTAMNLSSR